MTSLENLSIQDPSFAVLSEAFERFSETSQRLERKYQELVEETRVLRETVKEKELELKRQEKLALLGETAAAIAHEVRNPLGAMKLFLSLLRKDILDRPESVKLVDQIDSSIATLNHVVSNILQFSRDKTMPLGPVNLHSIIREQVLCFAPSESNRATIELHLDATPYIFANDGALRQVFYNIFLNALQATSYEGAISVHTKDVGESVFITIKDNGPGISPSVMNRIFEPFVTSKNEGTGLGLAIVRQIVEFHRGTVDAVSENGTEIRITLPRKCKESEL